MRFIKKIEIKVVKRLWYRWAIANIYLDLDTGETVAIATDEGFKGDRDLEFRATSELLATEGLKRKLESMS